MKQIFLFLSLMLLHLASPVRAHAFIVAPKAAQNTPSPKESLRTVPTTTQVGKLTFKQKWALMRQKYAPQKAKPKSKSSGDKTLGLLAIVFGGISLLMILMSTGKILSLLLGVAALVCGILGLKKSHYLMSLLGLIFGGIVVLLWIISGVDS
jgi:membrane-bound ClpP family serine protease